MRLLLTATLATTLLMPASAIAQSSATATGPGARAAVRASMALVMPAMFRVVEASAPQATWQGERFTEYLIKYTVAANTEWQFAADALPHGVSLLVRGGEWRGANDSDLVVQRGAVSNGTEVLVRVRVADGASPSWRDLLKFNATGVQLPTVRYVAED